MSNGERFEYKQEVNIIFWNNTLLSIWQCCQQVSKINVVGFLKYITSKCETKADEKNEWYE